MDISVVRTAPLQTTSLFEALYVDHSSHVQSSSLQKAALALNVSKEIDVCGHVLPRQGNTSTVQHTSPSTRITGGMQWEGGRWEEMGKEGDGG